MLALVFLCGAGAGALAMNMGVHSVMHQPAFDTPEGKIRFFERMQKELDLTSAQSEQMQSILNDFWQYYRSVLSDSKSRVEQILTEAAAPQIRADAARCPPAITPQPGWLEGCHGPSLRGRRTSKISA